MRRASLEDNLLHSVWAPGKHVNDSFASHQRMQPSVPSVRVGFCDLHREPSLRQKSLAEHV